MQGGWHALLSFHQALRLTLNFSLNPYDDQRRRIRERIGQLIEVQRRRLNECAKESTILPDFYRARR